MGGFVQVGAHGTGRLIAPVDNYVTKLKLVTPALGIIELSHQTNPALFQLAKVGLGCLGIVVEVTMECIPSHQLVEHTFVLSRKAAKKQLNSLLKKHKHVRYMWIPYTDAVVVVTNDPEDEVPDDFPRNSSSEKSQEEKSAPLTDLLAKLTEGSSPSYSEDDMKGMGFGELRGNVLLHSMFLSVETLMSFIILHLWILSNLSQMPSWQLIHLIWTMSSNVTMRKPSFGDATKDIKLNRAINCFNSTVEGR